MKDNSGFDFNDYAGAPVLFNGFILKGETENTNAYRFAQKAINLITAPYAQTALPDVIDSAVQRIIEDVQQNRPVMLEHRKLIGQPVLSPAPFTRPVIDAAGNPGKEVVNAGVAPGTQLQDYQVILADMKWLGADSGVSADKKIWRPISMKG